MRTRTHTHAHKCAHDHTPAQPAQVTSWGDFSSLESNPPGLHVQPLYRSPHGDSLVELALGNDAKQHQHHRQQQLEQLLDEHHRHRANVNGCVGALQGGTHFGAWAWVHARVWRRALLCCGPTSVGWPHAGPMRTCMGGITHAWVRICSHACSREVIPPCAHTHTCTQVERMRCVRACKKTRVCLQQTLCVLLSVPVARHAIVEAACCAEDLRFASPPLYMSIPH